MRRAWRHAHLLAAIVLGGCSGGEPMLDYVQATPQVATPQVVKTRAVEPVAIVALQPLVGPPRALAGKIVSQLNEAALHENVALVVGGNMKPSTALTGFMLAKAESANVKFTFVWDVFGPGGARIGRITGEEAIPLAAPPDDAWSAVSDNAIRSMATKVIAGIVTSVPK
jgi:hypothetical protein